MGGGLCENDGRTATLTCLSLIMFGLSTFPAHAHSRTEKVEGTVHCTTRDIWRTDLHEVVPGVEAVLLCGRLLHSSYQCYHV